MFSRTTAIAVGFGLALGGGVAFADTITPDSYEATVGLGESVTIRKTVVVEKEVKTALIDVMFLFDTTGSMGAGIAAAQADASAILTGLSGFGDLASGTGFYNDTPFDGVVSDLTTTDATTIASIGTFGAFGGGDFPERGNDAIKDAADNASWRAGSNRFIIALGDASFKDRVAAGFSGDAAVTASLAAKGIDLIGLDFCATSSAAFGGDYCGGFSDVDAAEDNFKEAIESLGGTSSTAAPGTIVADIIASITASFSTYTTVSVDDFGDGLPGVGVSTKCVSAAAGGACSGSDAVGVYDRSIDRTFEFDVTFTGLAPGVHTFDTFATVDGGKVAREADKITVGAPVPLPAAGWLMLAGIGGLIAARRRKA